MMPGTTLRYEESVVAVLGSLILCKIPSVENLRGTQRYESSFFRCVDDFVGIQTFVEGY